MLRRRGHATYALSHSAAHNSLSQLPNLSRSLSYPNVSTRAGADAVPGGKGYSSVPGGAAVPGDGLRERRGEDRPRLGAAQRAATKAQEDSGVAGLTDTNRRCVG